MPQFSDAEKNVERIMRDTHKGHLVTVPNCHVCNHEHRKEIEGLCTIGRPYTDIGRAFDIDRRGVSKHHKEHVNFEQDAIRRIIEDEASKLQMDHEEGVRGALLRRAYLATALQQSWQDLIEGKVQLEPRDTLTIIKQLEAEDSRVDSVATETLWSQFNAFKAAIKRVVPEQYWSQILDEARNIFDGETEDMSQEPPKPISQESIADAVEVSDE